MINIMDHNWDQKAVSVHDMDLYWDQMEGTVHDLYWD